MKRSVDPDWLIGLRAVEAMDPPARVIPSVLARTKNTAT
jgi:hypothetical protein